MDPHFNGSDGDLPPGVPPDIAFRAAKKHLNNPGLRGEKTPVIRDETAGIAFVILFLLVMAGAVGVGLFQRWAANAPIRLRDFDEIVVRSHCTRRIKSQLRDPDSYQFRSLSILSKDGPYGTARVFFRAKNGFGGYVFGSAVCEATPNGGDRMFKVAID